VKIVQVTNGIRNMMKKDIGVMRKMVSSVFDLL